MFVYVFVFVFVCFVFVIQGLGAVEALVQAQALCPVLDLVRQNMEAFGYEPPPEAADYC